jgi:hypothetical protein
MKSKDIMDLDSEDQNRVVEDALKEIEECLFKSDAEYVGKEEQKIRICYPHENVSFNKQVDNIKDYQVFLFNKLDDKVSYILLKSNQINNNTIVLCY